jgi:hypothetical protein
MQRKLGRKAIKTDSRTLKFAKYLTASLPAASDTIEYNLGSSDYSYKKLFVGEIAASGNVVVAGSVTGASWTATSDRREKHNIQTVDSKSALDKVMQLRAVTYNWNDPKQDKEKQTGWIAQEVEKVGLKSSVVTKSGELHHVDGTTTKVDDFKALKQNEMTAVLWAAVQEQQKEINQLKKQLEHRGKK